VKKSRFFATYVRMFSTLLCPVLLGSIFVSSSALAQTAQVSLSESSAQMKYSLLVGGQSFGRSEFGIGYLYNSDDNYILESGLHVIDEAGSAIPGLKVAVGGKVYGAVIPSRQILALGLGGGLRYAIPNNERLAISVEGYYSPEIVTYLDATNFWELALRVEYEILQQASGFVEGRQFETKLNNGVSGSIDEGVRLGIRLEF